MTEEMITVHPVVQYDLHAVVKLNCALLVMHFIAAPGGQPQESPKFALTPVQLRALAQSLERTSTTLEAGNAPAGGAPTN